MTEAPAEFFRVIDLSMVPVPDFVEALNYESIRQAAIDYFVSLDPANNALVESDPIIKLIEAFAYRELNLRQRINDMGLANTITASLGNDLAVIGAFFGVTPMEGENTERFRRRVQLGIYTGAVAGPRQSYEFHALSAHAAVVDVGVHSPAPGEVAVTVLASEDVATETASDQERLVGRALFAQPVNADVSRILARPSSAVLQAVRVALSGEAVRPLTDSVTVQPPTVAPFSIRARLVVYPGPEAATVRANALTSLAAYLQRIRKVGYDATLSGIIAALTVGGVQNVILTSPVADVVASHYDLPVCVAVDVEVERFDV
ncbi:baseplate J/gp47 family protein [Neorhizobium sp. T786]|uniref:baseplate assembly protein n=1 Tax=Pseudorhizobium xiangyangii TaxID=2883104 RepID=UPI001CFFE12C|nr:baseplate J/gp47 family protein [Neorhizobium xiangyangii]MCB5201720.1 baseplate J/gp47 family protein [Neorhizobium xiangyangii]